eukprot:Nitzschia sp. Nitz4//scaffold87_size112219//20130//20816//NITZ4_004064-RA/size112219-processed-gene-0.19-mRNA-1//-1//CDS//3329559339//554//frame0
MKDTSELPAVQTPTGSSTTGGTTSTTVETSAPCAASTSTAIAHETPRVKTNSASTALPLTSTPVGNTGPRMKDMDVSCDKGRGSHERRQGNQLYKLLIDLYKSRYVTLMSANRPLIITQIMDQIKAEGGWFVEPHSRGQLSGVYMSEEKARKKISDDLTRAARRPRESRVAEFDRKRKLRENRKNVASLVEEESSPPPSTMDIKESGVSCLLTAAAMNSHEPNCSAEV